MSTVQINLKRNWLDCLGQRRRLRGNPHSIPKAWWDEQRVPSDAVLVEGPAPSRAPRPLDAVDADAAFKKSLHENDGKPIVLPEVGAADRALTLTAGRDMKPAGKKQKG